MLGKLSHWLSARLEDKEGGLGANAVFVRQRYDALVRVADNDPRFTRLKNATLAVVRKENAADQSEAGSEEARAPAREQREQLTQDDVCVGELCVALEDCLVLGLKQASEQEPTSWWKVLYASTLIVDEATLVQSVLSAAFLSEVCTDSYEESHWKARCWLKLALNNHTIESSIMVSAGFSGRPQEPQALTIRAFIAYQMIFSMACEHLIRNNYEEWSLVRCSEGLGLFLELIIALRDVHFAIEVNDDTFRLPEAAEASEIVLESVGNETGGEMITTITDADIAAAVGASPSRAGSFVPIENVSELAEVEITEISEAIAVEEEGEDDDFFEVSSATFPHRHKGIKPWQYVFGVSLASLSKNPYHSRYALIDPVLAIPNVVADCIAVLRQFPDTPRLFRATVLNVRVNQLREIVETEGAVPADLDAQCAGALLLDFLKNLPDPLLTADKYDAFVAAGQLRDEDASVRNITFLVHDLPIHCQIVLKKLIGLMHFLQQAEHSELNGVDVFTSSMALAPVIAFKKEATGTLPSEPRSRSHSQYQDVRYAAVGAQVVERMIQHYEIIFQDVRQRISDALERLETKKDALKRVPQLLKMQPQLNFLADKQQVDEITRLFRDSLRASETSPPASPNNPDSTQVAGALKTEPAVEIQGENGQTTAFGLELDVPNPAVMTPVGSPTRANNAPASSFSLASASEPTEQQIVTIWEQFGFNSPTVLGNFQRGGVLLLRAMVYWLNNDPEALPCLKFRALPSALPSYDAGLVASAICKALVKLLKLTPSSEQPELDMVALSLEPFWELFEEELYFNKLFVLMFQVFDQLWSELDPEAASFTRVICEAQVLMNDMLDKAPACVDDLRSEWEEMRKRRVEEERDEVQAVELTEGDEFRIAEPPRPRKKASFHYNPTDYLSKLIDASSILSLDQVAYLDNALPITCQLCRWYRLYGLEANGSSLETLLILAKSRSPTLLVVKDAEGNVFGGFASDEWHRALHYYGTGETFLFSFASPNAAGGFVKYAWSRKNSYFLLCSEESLIMGGGGSFGLFLVRFPAF
ncbi:hypothetical protein BBJ28_00000239 [Nothophytophthora sp. Chile5]|nr:hypothetical protein BBJ28_00000239 [Nothophytophthora sp. Chile5]